MTPNSGEVEELKKVHPIVIIVPVGPDEGEDFLSRWIEVSQSAPDHQRVIFSLCHGHHLGHRFSQAAVSHPESITTLFANSQGRAAQINWALKNLSKGDVRIICICHYDCNLKPVHIRSLLARVKPGDQTIYHFRLKFSESSQFPMLRINEWGARIRSSYLKLPFGDQGFALSQTTLHQLGPLPEGLPYGEDHAWVWHAHIQGIKISEIPLPLETSARKYLNRGWTRTTAQHLYLTLRQATPFFKQLIALKATRTPPGTTP